MKRTVLIAIVVIISIGASVGQNVKSILDSANQAYAQGRFEKSIELYNRILAQGKEAPGIYYNLGNAYYKTHQLAPAILNYEKARLRAPQNEDIHYNLELARQQVTDKIDKIPDFFLTRWFRNFVNIFSSDTWAVISMVTFILFLVLFSLYLYSNRLGLKKTSFWTGILALIITVASFAFALQQKKDIINSQQAIVFSSKVTVRSSPAESGTELFVIHEGTKVYLEEKMGEWYEIRLADGSQGWLKHTHIEPI
jgi:tetratricopeptide (TPR) repeat protein